MICDDRIEQLLYCLEANLPHPVIAVLLELTDDPAMLHDAWLVWSVEEYGLSDRFQFADVVENLTGCAIITCADCSGWEWSDDASEINSVDMVCEGCLRDYSQCYGCEVYTHNEEVTWVEGCAYCDRDCLSEYCSWCDHCEEWSRGDHEHNEDCECEAPHRRFLFPANGGGTVANDERLDVTLPAGTIDEVGLRRIRQMLFDETHAYGAVEKAVDAVGDQWQAKRGNFTRRLSRELYSNHKIKVAEGVLSEIGNLARQHSSDSSTWAIEFTRDLNLGPSEFCHEESCWWQSYSESRCALKNWGGLGLRVFDEDETAVGRAWVQPLDPDFNPTHDTLNAHAYLIYNCYGELGGYEAARIVAHLTSRTYRKVEVDSDAQYINSNAGWLVADEPACTNLTGLSFTGSAHDTYDAHTIDREVAR